MSLLKDNEQQQTIALLIADPAYKNNPLLPALNYLFEQDKKHRLRVERLLKISDGYSNVSYQQNQDLFERYDKQIRRLEKITRISDNYQHAMRELNEQLKLSSLQDPLTGLGNRRMLLEHLKAEVARIQRGNLKYALLMLDIDRFKQVNDNYGHEVGDRVLCHIAKILTHALREGDICVRWGGEEFLIMLPETSADAATSIAKRLLDAVRQSEQIVLNDQGKEMSLSLTTSIGITCYQLGEHYEETIKRADDALYAAKSNGRDQIASDFPE